MVSDFAVLISFTLYLTFFGWLGWRRGFAREIIVFVVALVSWLLLELRGDFVIRFGNLAAAAIDLVRSGGLAEGEQALSAIASAEPAITDANEMSYKFVLWVIIFILTYLLTNWLIEDKKSRRNGWAALIGTLNGVFFSIAFFPSLLALFGPSADTTTATAAAGEELSLFEILRNGLQVLLDGLAAIWDSITQLGSLGLLIAFTLLLVLIALTIRSGAKAKS